MFQSFNTTTQPEFAAMRVDRLRQEMEMLGLDGFLVPRADEHQGEYVPPNAQRLTWLTGFNGSAGVALVLKNSALIFVDGRYSAQVRQQTDADVFTYHDLISCPPSQWIIENSQGLTIGFDPWLHTMAAVKTLRQNVEEKANGKLVAVEKNLIDIIWHDQPEPPTGAVSIHPFEYAGEYVWQKCAILQEALVKKQADICILTDPASIAWTFNIRGHDVSNTPFPLSFALIHDKLRPSLFIAEEKLGEKEKEYLEKHVDLYAPSALIIEIKKAAQAKKRFMLDPHLVADKLGHIIAEENGIIIEEQDPVSLLRACKNQEELNGARAANKRDGVALCKFLAWLSRQNIGSVSEISAAQELEKFRINTAEALGSKLLDLSFDAISSAGPNSAIIHYRVTERTNRILQENQLYLIDSGGQYRDGTTDVTRTIAIGKPSEEEKHCFTLVLKGMINISLACFPKNTRGQDIDVLARFNLWKAGKDYAHGTGHGIGSYLSVHEGPQNISKRGSQELLAGMILSNEPGYYRDGAFGIRIENLLIVEEAALINGGDLPMHKFETITFCPIDRKLIIPKLLNKEERDWLNNYHQNVYTQIAPFLDAAEKEWLKAATEKL